MSEKENSAFIERFTIRMPDGMRDAIAQRAKTNGRSMNSEIIQILEDALSISKHRNDLEGVAFSHADDSGVHTYDNPDDIVNYIERRADEFKKNMINDLQHFKIGRKQED